MQKPFRKGAARLIVGYAAIAFSLPYLGLKIAWISGAPVGMLDKSLVAAPGAGLLIVALIGSIVAAQARSGFSEVARPQYSNVMQFMPGDDVCDGSHA